MDIASLIISLIILLFSVILHEIAHGTVAEYFGDNTARLMGRLSLNPLVHIDLYYTILMPLLLALAHLPVLGAAKPVPVNYNNLRNFRWGVFWVSIAGILTNLCIAFIFSIPLHFAASLPQAAINVFSTVVILNIYLAVVNMLPIPPIDGSKVLAALFGEKAIYKVSQFERFGIIPFVIFIYLVFSFAPFQNAMTSVVSFFFKIFGLGSVVG
jgi:Zn-dependent protease